MSIVLDGTTGITNDSGYTGDGVSFADSTPANTLVTTSGGNVGIGTSSPTFSTGGGLQISRTGGPATLNLQRTDGVVGEVRVGTIGMTLSADPSNTVADTSMNFQVDGAEHMRITSAGNVGIGTSSPGSNRLYINAPDGTAPLTLNSAGGSDTTRALNFNVAGDNYGKILVPSGSGGAMAFWTGGANAAAERARIDSSGNFGVGSSTIIGKMQVTVGDIAPSSSGNMNGFVISTNNVGNGLSFGTADSAGGYNWISSGYTNSANSGRPLRIIPGSQGVQLAANGTSWTSLSDERYKTDLTPIEDAVSKVGALRSVTGRFISDEETKRRSFLIAQDVQSVFPEAVDASDPGRLGVQYTEVIPLLVAAIKELKAEVDSLKAQINGANA